MVTRRPRALAATCVSELGATRGVTSARSLHSGFVGGLIVTMLVAWPSPHRAAAQANDPPCPPGLCVPVNVSFSSFLSPPVVAPIYACTSLVTVSGFVPGATVVIGLDGEDVVSQVGTNPDRLTLDLAPYLVGGEFTVPQQVTARQKLEGDSSATSEPVVVRDYLLDFPDGLPVPVIEPLPIYECGRALATSGVVRGSTVTITDYTAAPPGVVAEFDAWSEWPGIAVDPAHLYGQGYMARYGLCGDMPSEWSEKQPVEYAPPEPLAAPSIVNLQVIEGQSFLALADVVFGAKVSLTLDGMSFAQHIGFQGLARTEVLELPRAVVEGEILRPSQGLCATGTPGTAVPVSGCSALPPPQIRMPQVGDKYIDVDVYIPGSRITIFVGGVELGDGGGRRIRLHRALNMGETVTVVQRLGTCTSTLGFQTTVACAAVDQLIDESGFGPFGVGSATYQLPDTVLLGDRQVTIAGEVRFPTDRLTGDPVVPASGVRPFPLALVMHGNATVLYRPGSSPTCQPRASWPIWEAMGYTVVRSYEGYRPLLDALARAGYVAVSIDANDLCGAGGGAYTYLDEGANLYIEHMRLWRSIQQGIAGSVLAGADTGSDGTQVPLGWRSARRVRAPGGPFRQRHGGDARRYPVSRARRVTRR